MVSVISPMPLSKRLIVKDINSLRYNLIKKNVTVCGMV